MSFWDRFYDLCIKNGTKPSPVVKQLGISSGSVTKWKNGTLPTLETAILIANHFNVSVGYLTGDSDNPEPPQKEPTRQEIDKLIDKMPESKQEALLNFLKTL